MEARDVHTRDSFIEAQLDTVSAAARNILPLVARDLWFTGQTAAAGTPERRRQRALALLAEWNGEMNEHLPEPLIYAAWMRELQQPSDPGRDRPARRGVSRQLRADLHRNVSFRDHRRGQCMVRTSCKIDRRGNLQPTSRGFPLGRRAAMAGGNATGGRRGKLGAGAPAHEARPTITRCWGDNRGCFPGSLKHPPTHHRAGISRLNRAGDARHDARTRSPSTQMPRGYRGILRFRRSRQFGFRDRQRAPVRAIRSRATTTTWASCGGAAKYIPQLTVRSRPCPCGQQSGSPR